MHEATDEIRKAEALLAASVGSADVPIAISALVRAILALVYVIEARQ